jgi:signal transduction histidine kinase
VSALRRWLRDERVVVDAAITLVVAVLSVFDVASASAEHVAGEEPADWFAYVLVLVGSVGLLWRRRSPVTMLAVGTGAAAVFWLRGHGAYLSVLGIALFYSAAVHAEHRRRTWFALAGAFLLVVATTGVSLLDRPDGFAWFPALSIVAFLVSAVVVGLVIRNRERIFVDTERRAVAAEADRIAAAERAVASERSRIAREMHDVVAHSMSVVAVQAAAGREIIQADPVKAAEVFARIERVGRESLTELRRMLGVLRDTGDTAASFAPQPGIADIAAAAAASSDGGVATELVVDGSQRPLPPGIELAAYRIVQEALTNVRKHAGASASVTVHITYCDDSLVVDVTDDGLGAVTSLSTSGTGHGLIGMRERVEIYGGHLSAGPRPGGGFTVRAVLPSGSAS